MIAWTYGVIRDFDGELAGMIKSREKVVLLIAVILILMSRVWNIADLCGPIVFDDEAGYWGHAANMMGLKWKNVESTWFSYGYSLLLSTLFFFSHNMDVLYRLAIVFNAVLGIAGLFLGIRLLDELEIGCSNTLKVGISFLASFYSAYIFQSQIAWPESFLYTWFLLVMLLGVRFCKKCDKRNSLLFTLSVFFLYVIHNRALAVIVAYLMLLCYMFLQRKVSAQKLTKILFILVALVCINDYMKDHVTLMMFGDQGGFSNNNFASNMNKASVVSSLNGWLRLFLSLLGKLWYLFTATFLLAFSGMIFIVKKYVKLLKEHKQDGLKYFYFFAGMCVLGTLAVATISTLPPIIDYTQKTRLDVFFYGRYTDTVSGILIIFGILNLIESVKEIRNFLEYIFVLVVYLFCTCMLYLQINDVSWYYVNITCVPGIWDAGNINIILCAGAAIIIYLLGAILIHAKRNRMTKIAGYIGFGLVMPFCFLSVSQKAYSTAVEPLQSHYSDYKDIYDILDQYAGVPIYAVESDHLYEQAARTRVIEGDFKYDLPPEYASDFFVLANDEGFLMEEYRGFSRQFARERLNEKEYFLVARNKEGVGGEENAAFYHVITVNGQYLLAKGSKLVSLLRKDGFECNEFVYWVQREGIWQDERK